MLAEAPIEAFVQSIHPPDQPVLRTLFIPFYVPIKKVLEQVGRAFRDSDVVRIQGQPLRVFCIADPERVGQLYSDRQAGGGKLPRLLPRVKYVMGNGGFISAGGEAYRKRRQQVQPAFRRSTVPDYLRGIPPIVEEELAHWAAPANSGDAFDIYRPIRKLMMKVNMRMLLSVGLSDREVEELDEETHYLEKNFIKISPLAVPFPSNIRFRRLAVRLRSRMRRIVEQHRASGGDGLLSHLTGLRHENGEPWSDKDVVDELTSIHFGGSVMSSTLALTFHQLGENLRVQEKLAAEAETLAGQTPDAASLAALTYGQAVLKEAIRFYPAVWGYPRWTDHELDLGGIRIPAKSLVIPMVYLLHRNPRLWQDPERFWPERFEGENAPAQNSFRYLPFSAGPRTCLGMQLAPVVMQLVLNMALSCYRIISCPRFPGDPDLDLGFGLQPLDEVRVRLEIRARNGCSLDSALAAESAPDRP